MKYYTQSIFLLFLSILFTNCGNRQHQEISSTIDSFYTRSAAGDYRMANKSLLTPELADMIEAATSKQAASAAALKTAGSTDKPNMIEGDIFTSVLEGSTEHKVLSIIVNGTTAEATVQFNHTQYDNLQWSDRVQLQQINGAWKINDVIYAPGKGAGKSTREVLTQFLLLPDELPKSNAQSSP